MSDNNRQRNVDSTAGSLTRYGGGVLIPPPPSVLTPDVADAIRADLTVLPPVLNAGMVTDDREYASIQTAGRIRSGTITTGGDQSLFMDPVRYDGFLQNQNICGNPGFEVNTAGWATTGGTATIARSTVAGHFLNGVAGLDYTQAGAVNANISLVYNNNGPQGAGIPAIAGHDYTFSIWCNTVNARLGSANLDWLRANGTVISTTTGVNFLMGSGLWNFRWVGGTAPTGAVGVRASFLYSGAIGDVAKFDNAAIWDRTAWTNLGWVIQSLDVFLVTQSPDVKSVTVGSSLLETGTTYNTTNYLFIVGQGGVSYTGYIDSPILDYDPTRAYETAWSCYIGSSAITSIGAATRFLNSVGGLLTNDGAANSDAVQPVNLNTTTYTKAGSFQQGPFTLAGTGGPGAGNYPTTTRVRSRYLWANNGSTDSIYASFMQTTKGGTITGHLSPVGAIDSLQAGSNALSNHTIVTGSTWEGWSTSGPGTYQIYTPSSNRSFVLQARVVGQFNSGSATATFAVIRLSASFDNGVTYSAVTNQVGVTIIAASAAFFIANEGTFKGTGSGPILVKVECLQSAGGTAGNFATGTLNWMITPA